MQSSLRVAHTYAFANVELPLLGQANVWVEDSVQDRTSIGYVQAILQQALELTAPGQLELIVFDPSLAGIAAPFEGLNDGGERLLRTMNDAREFKRTLEFLRDHIQGVNNVIQGRAATLNDFRCQVDYPVEGYKLVVLSSDVSSLDDETLNLLTTLLKAGPRGGVSFIVHSTTLDVNPYFVKLFDKVTCRPGTVAIQGYQPVAWKPPSANALIESASRVANELATVQLSRINFADVQPIAEAPTASSADGVTFAIGRYGLNTVEVTLGDELNQRHNVLITGAVGQGKSNLLSVVIHSLAQRYSPAELELYLLDFKEGVTLQRFHDAASGEYLPHARVLGLEADREFGLSLFRHLFGLYKGRMRVFKDEGVANIKEYRRLGHPMPRLVVMIDEFQLMFSDKDRISDEIADHLIKGARLFRACGIHIILASQTIGGNLALMGSAGDGLFGQVPIRIALKNSLAESHATLGPKNEAAAHLRAREAIVNLDYGAAAANRKMSIAFADEEVLTPLRRRWWQQYHKDFEAPYVFAGDRARFLEDDADHLSRLAESGQSPTALLGSRIEVDARPLAIRMPRDVGRNICILGAGDGVAEVASVARSLAAQAGTTPMRFVVLDLLEAQPEWTVRRDQIAAQLAALPGCDVEIAGKYQLPGTLDDLASEILRGDRPATNIYVLGLGLDRIRSMPDAFQDVIRTGSVEGVHLIGWWTKLDSFKEHVGYGGESHFDVRLALRLDAQSVKQFMNDPLLDWKATDNRALAWDTAFMPQPVPVIPYALAGAGEPDKRKMEGPAWR